MMEATSTQGKEPARVQSPRQEAAASAGTNATKAAAAAAQGHKMQVPQMPQVLVEKADEMTQRITSTDIKRINGYMRLANLVFAGLLEITCLIRLFSISSYSHFLVVIYIMFLAGGLVFIENHEMFPSVAEKVKINFGFMFTAFGKASYILSISFLAFSQGWIGTLIGIFFMILALFNYFLIYKHPAYHSEMTKTEASARQEDEDLEEMPELRYNQTTTTTTNTKASHVVV